jgi:hypothetical protein
MTLDAELAQERDVRRRAAEADAADSPPLDEDGREGGPIVLVHELDRQVCTSEPGQVSESR